VTYRTEIQVVITDLHDIYDNGHPLTVEWKALRLTVHKIVSNEIENMET
jgi:hypothetical protein